MSKPSQSIAIAESSLRIEVRDIIKRSYINELKKYKGILSWKNAKGEITNRIRFEVNLSSEENYVCLNYIAKSNPDNNRKNIEQKIYFKKVKSNLGKGDIYYFLCPKTKYRCRILYLTYGSYYFQSRFAYTKRIYYRCQIYSKNLYATDRYFKLTEKHKKMLSSSYRKSYIGKKTRSLESIERLENDIKYFDAMRKLNMYHALSKLKKI